MKDHTQFLASGRRLDQGRWTVAAAVALLMLVLTWLGAVDLWAGIAVALVMTGMVIMLFREDSVRAPLSPGAQRPKANIETDPAIRLWRAALDHFPNSVVLLDQDGRVIESNGQTHLLVSAARPGRHISAVFRSPLVLDAVSRILSGGAEEKVDFITPVPVEHEMRAHCIPVRLGPTDGPSPAAGGLIALIVLDDLTEARRVEQMRVDFIANASHELRTPLASLSGFIETLRGHAKADPEAQEKFLAIMHQQSIRMRRLIDDLLSLSRIELNEHVPPSSKVDMRGVAWDVRDTLTPIAADADVEIRVDAPEDLPPALATREEMTQVVQNLVDNAIKYGKSGKFVDVRLSTVPVEGDQEGKGFIVVEVRDYGEGIPRADIPRLTERFYRVDVARSREEGGTGLGLAIVKHIVNRHRGTIDIESLQNQGSTFRITIPIA